MVSVSLSLGSINFLEQLIELKEIHIYPFAMKDIAKDTDKQWMEEMEGIDMWKGSWRFWDLFVCTALQEPPQAQLLKSSLNPIH